MIVIIMCVLRGSELNIQFSLTHTYTYAHTRTHLEGWEAPSEHRLCNEGRRCAKIQTGDGSPLSCPLLSGGVPDLLHQGVTYGGYGMLMYGVDVDVCVGMFCLGLCSILYLFNLYFFIYVINILSVVISGLYLCKIWLFFFFFFFPDMNTTENNNKLLYKWGWNCHYLKKTNT